MKRESEKCIIEEVSFVHIRKVRRENERERDKNVERMGKCYKKGNEK